MALKKKQEAASSSESSSSSSSSTSSSTSSSGTDSSSSDSENSSTSVNKSGQASSDSEKKPTPKKKGSAPPSTKNKPPEPAESEKPKDKAAKGRSSTKPPPQVYSSDSDDSSPKANLKRKPQAKPKASATVTPLPKVSKVASRPPPKKPNPPRKAAQKTGLKDPPKPAPKLEDPKKLAAKTKSIFSPDNSSDSDDQTSTPPPPKLTAMKTAATKSMKSKPKPKPSPVKPERKTRTSSVSSNSSDSSRSSRSSSESSTSRTTPKNTHKGGPPATRRAATTPTPKKDSKKGPPPPSLTPDKENPPVRKQTRSTSARKSKHLISSRVPSESDSESMGSKTSLTKSPVKKPIPKMPQSNTFKKTKEAMEDDMSMIMEEEERRCPIEGCDSSGHLSGRYDKHFTIEACPIYHNFTPQQCKELYAERKKKEEERRKALSLVKIGQISSPTPEQKAYREKVKEMRSRFVPKEKEDNDEDEEPVKDRQPDISHATNKYDLKLFIEAQAAASEIIEEELKVLANVRCTKHIRMGKYEMEVWYQSPYPEDYARLPKMYICEFCLKYMKAKSSLNRHLIKCLWRHPPGEEVYRKDRISVWEVDGKRYKTYCQNLCLLAKFFLDHKTLYYDVEPFLFYVMTIGDSDGCHTVGYFSKEKNSFLNYNVSCILTLPPYQRQGYGRLLIDFSYLLTRVEGKIGSPEKPLSDLGLISYRSYWKDVLLEYLCNLGGKQISVKDISQEMAINSYDIVSTLQALGMMKYWKGKHIILKKQDVIEEYVERSKRRGGDYKEIDRECLKWTPFVPPNHSGSS